MAEAPWLALNFGSSGHWEAARVTNQPFKVSKKGKKIQSFKRPALHCIGQWREWPTSLNLDFKLEKKVGSNIVENLANICKLARFINFCAIVFSFCKTGVRQMPQRHFLKGSGEVSKKAINLKFAWNQHNPDLKLTGTKTVDSTHSTQGLPL